MPEITIDSVVRDELTYICIKEEKSSDKDCIQYLIDIYKDLGTPWQCDKCGYHEWDSNSQDFPFYKIK